MTTETRSPAAKLTGKMHPVAFHKFLTDEGQGVQGYPPIGECAVCGNAIWHCWIFVDGQGNEFMVGQECARIACGGDPRQALRDEAQRAAALEAEREEAIRIAELADWRKAPEQAALRRTLVLGARAEKQAGNPACDLWQKGLRAFRRGSLSEKFVAFLAKQGDSQESAKRNAIAEAAMWALAWANTGMYDTSIVRDFSGKETNAFSPKQAEMLLGMTWKYRKQILAGEFYARPWNKPLIDAALALGKQIAEAKKAAKQAAKGA